MQTSRQESVFSPLKIISCHFQYLSALCISPLASAQAGPAPDILIIRRKLEERKLWKEISVQMCPLILPLPPLCPHSNLSTSVPSLVPPCRAGNWARRSEPAFRGPRQAGMRCLLRGEGGHCPNCEPESHWQPCLRDLGGNEWDPKCLGVHCGKWHPADEHNNTHCLFMSLQLGLKHKEPGKVLLDLYEDLADRNWSKISRRDQSPRKNINKPHSLIYRFSSAVDRSQMFYR